MKFADALALGRVSNLPTVWTNAIAGVVIAGGDLSRPGVPALFAALTLFYIGGMYLNDFFDADIDARERPERPIPAGRVSARTVGSIACALLLLGTALLGYAGAVAGTLPWPVVAGVALGACIVFYNWHHKGNVFSPFVMGACRMLVYICAGLVVVSALPLSLWISSLVLLCYLIGLTYVAKQENLGEIANMWPLLFLAVPFFYVLYNAFTIPTVVWGFLALLGAWILVALYFVRRRAPGDIPRAVVSLIAGISLVDAVLVAGHGLTTLALLCVAGFLLTLVLQRFVAGT